VWIDKTNLPEKFPVMVVDTKFYFYDLCNIVR
jgi:hypothetical protein